jgi:hypothetical protein
MIYILELLWKLLNVITDDVKEAHGLKIQGRGYRKFLPKSQGGSRLSGQIAMGVPLFRVLYIIAFLLTNLCVFTLPLLPPPCVLLCILLTMIGYLIIVRQVFHLMFSLELTPIFNNRSNVTLITNIRC